MRPYMHKRHIAAALVAAAVGSAALAGATTPVSYGVPFDRALAEAKTAVMANPEQALGKADAAIREAKRITDPRQAALAEATASWVKAEAYLNVNKPKEAAPLVASGLKLSERLAPKAKLHGDLLRSKGGIEAVSGDIQGALAVYQSAFDVFRSAGETRSQAITLQDIGMMYWEAGDYPRALRYYEQAIDLYSGDPSFLLSTHNNKGEVLRKLGRRAEAEREFQIALASAQALDSPVLSVRILENIALVQAEQKKLVDAERTVRRATLLAQSGEAASWRPFVVAVAAKVAAERGNYVQAGALLNEAFAGVNLAATELPYKEFHELAADVFERLGDKDRALTHLKAFRRLDTESRNLTASASSQLMSARFDFANQNLAISQLKRGQLERDVKLERQRSRFKTTVFSGVLAAVTVILALLAYGFVSLRRSRNETRAANRVLTEVNTKLESALKAKTDFLATTSHEIRTPLNGILGMTQILLTNRTLVGEMREQVQVVHGAGETMRALVDDILDVAKMETGELAIAHVSTDVQRILEEATLLWSGQASAKGLTLESDIVGAPDAMMTDAVRLRQIVFNLLSNAVKFTPSGSVTLRCWIEPSDMAHASSLLKIQISDTGIGIPDDQLAKVFEPFHQVDAGTSRQFSGTGLGLSICRNIVQAMGGTLVAESSLGGGSTFTLSVPAVLPIIEQASGQSVDDVPVETQNRFVLVEGNALHQAVMRTVLEPNFPDLEVVEDGEAAIRAFERGAVQHLLIEARSANIAGLSPLASLRALVVLGHEAGARVTVLLAASEELAVGDVAQIGADQIVLKPVSGSKLLAFLRTDDALPSSGAASVSAAA